MQQFKGKKIAIVGLSVEGLDSVKFFSTQSAAITCCDRRTKEELGDIYTQLGQYSVTFQLGEAYLDGISQADIVVRSPGISPKLPEFEKLRENGREITSLTKLFFDLCPARIIGVTGTKGKGTTSTLISRMVAADGKRVHLGGNVGTPLLSKLSDIQMSDWIVLELSSFQLEDLTKSPHVAVVLKVTQDHLANFDTLASNFHATREEYVEAKRSIVRYQTSRDFAVCNANDETSISFAKITRATSYFFSRSKDSVDAFVKNDAVWMMIEGKIQKVCDSSSVKLRGIHNLENIAAAALACRCAGISLEAIQKAATTFAGLEHRLEVARIVGGVTYVNDSFSTVPDTTIAAIESFKDPIILIAGGSEKGSDFTELGQKLAKSRVKVLLAIGAMTSRIVDAARAANYNGKIITGLVNMHEIVTTAHGEAKKGDVVLLSPACASFGMFKNYKERGKLFKYEASLL